MQSNQLKDEQIINALYADAYSYDPPADLKQRIDAQIARQKKEVIYMKKMSVKKVAIVAAALCALTGTVCMAGGKIAGYAGGTRLGSQTGDFSDIGKLEKKLGLSVNAPESFDNGYAFADASIADFDALDADGIKVGNESELDIAYEKDGKRLNYSVKKGATVLSDAELASAQVIEQDGVTYYSFRLMRSRRQRKRQHRMPERFSSLPEVMSARSRLPTVCGGMSMARVIHCWALISI